MSLIIVIALSLFGGLLCLGLTAAIGFGVPKLIGSRMELFESVMLSVLFYGPVAFGVGVAATFYYLQWHRTRESAWLSPTLWSVAAVVSILLLSAWNLVRQK